MVAAFPKAGRKGRDADAEREMAPVIAVVSAIRTVRSESRISPAVELTVTVRCPTKDAARLHAAVPLIGALARAVDVDRAARPPLPPTPWRAARTSSCTCRVSWTGRRAGAFQKEIEKARRQPSSRASSGARLRRARAG
jgi:valyl-tRNA synthetase